MLTAIATVLSLVLTNNIVMSGVKWLSFKKETTTWLRGALLVFSALGVIAAAALNGSPIDFNQLSDLGAALLQTLSVAIVSHATYKVIKNA